MHVDWQFREYLTGLDFFEENNAVNNGIKFQGRFGQEHGIY